MQKVRCIFFNSQMELCSLGHTKDQCSPDCPEWTLEEELEPENEYDEEEMMSILEEHILEEEE
jgi:hypothetical protein